MKHTIFILTILLNFQITYSQIGIGEWRDHLPYHDGKLVVEAGNKIFCSTPYALFYYNKNDKSVNKLSKINGLSDIKPCALAYSKKNDLLFVAYENANLDIIIGNQIINIDDIKNKTIQGDKKIYDINIHNQLAYLSCGFGIVVFDINKKEVKDTYYIGNNASSTVVYSTTVADNYIYAATDEGIYFANIKTANLVDYNQWQKVSNIDFPTGKYQSIINFNSQILTGYYDKANRKTTIYKKTAAQWVQVYSTPREFKKLRAFDDQLFVICKNLLVSFNKNLTISNTVEKYEFGTAAPNDCIKTQDGIIYIADSNYGLVINSKSKNETIDINSPLYNHVADINARGNKICVAGGGRNAYWGNLWRYAEMYEFKKEKWYSKILWSEEVYDFVKVLINPFNINQVYLASWSRGIYLFENRKLIKVYDDTNSTLQSAIAGKHIVNIGGIVIDDNQNLYAINSGVESPISVKTAKGKWYSYKYPGISNYGRIGSIINTQYNHKWVQLGNGGGIFAFDDNNTFSDTKDDKYRQFSLSDANGNIVTNEVLSMAEDHDGVVWVGTDQGVFTYFNAQNVFSGKNFYADRIKVVDNSADTLVQYLLAKERINTIAIDGANRKWFGTENSGVFLMSEDCRNEIFHFTADNSKLLSNSINSIAIQEETGEVFIGTNIGIVSFKGTSTKGTDDFKNAYIYPNPVRENYSGEITITGLVKNVNVKITDISGQLVYETTAFGGQAIWNGKNYSGNKVKTGVYLVFCTDEQGEKTKILKLLIIN